jgi:hypothetical protein
MPLTYTDADALLTTFNVGDFVNSSNGSVLSTSTLEEMLEKEELHIPFPTSLSLMTAAKHLITLWQMKNFKFNETLS